MRYELRAINNMDNASTPIWGDSVFLFDSILVRDKGIDYLFCLKPFINSISTIAKTAKNTDASVERIITNDLFG